MENLVHSGMTGMRNACEQSAAFYNGHFTNLRPEYLITVNVAQQIKKDFEDHMIWLEESTDDFRKNSANIDAKWDAFVEVIRDKDYVNRRGYVNMVVYDASKNPVCGIEIKGREPQNKPRLEDLIRNRDFLTYNAGQSTLKHTLLAYVMEPNCKFDEEISVEIAKIKEAVDKEMQEFCAQQLDYQLSVEEVFSTIHTAGTSFDDYAPEDRSEVYQNVTLYLGVIIVFSVKP